MPLRTARKCASWLPAITDSATIIIKMPLNAEMQLISSSIQTARDVALSLMINPVPLIKYAKYASLDTISPNQLPLVARRLALWVAKLFRKFYLFVPPLTLSSLLINQLMQSRSVWKKQMIQLLQERMGSASFPSQLNFSNRPLNIFLLSSTLSIQGLRRRFTLEKAIISCFPVATPNLLAP